MQLPVYVINLDRRPDRWAVMSEQLGRLGIEAERIPAVDARTLSAGRLKSPPFGKINPASAGNMFSQGRAMRLFLQSGAPAALILEDDVELADDTASLLSTFDWWPSSARLVRLHDDGMGRPTMLGPPVAGTPAGRLVHRTERWVASAGAYIVDRDGAALALRAFADPSLTLDLTLMDQRISRTARMLRPHQIVPAMARHRDTEDSDQESWREEWPMRRYTMRRIFALPYKARYHFLVLSGQVRRYDVPFSEGMADTVETSTNSD